MLNHWVTAIWILYDNLKKYIKYDSQCKEEKSTRYSVLFFHIDIFGWVVREPDRKHGLTVLNQWRHTTGDVHEIQL